MCTLHPHFLLHCLSSLLLCCVFLCADRSDGPTAITFSISFSDDDDNDDEREGERGGEGMSLLHTHCDVTAVQ